MSSNPRKAVIDPVGSFSAARETGRPYRSDDPLILRMAAADATAAAVSPTSSTTRRSSELAVLATTESMSSVGTPSCAGPPMGTKGSD